VYWHRMTILAMTGSSSTPLVSCSGSQRRAAGAGSIEKMMRRRPGRTMPYL
jgi:hypothetical protein